MSFTRDDVFSQRKPKFKLPKGYEDEWVFLDEMRKIFADNTGADRLNREASLEDLRFVVGDQWDDITRQRREAAFKPVLTINRLPAFIAQVLGSRRLNETEILVRPDNGGTEPIAQVREGLIRQIQKESRAKQAYDNALAGAVMAGLGAFQVVMKECDDDVFKQKITIQKIADHMSVLWDYRGTDNTGADAQNCFVIDSMSRAQFYANWPWATPSDVMSDMNMRGDLRMVGWVSVDDVRVVNYWRIRERETVMAMMMDGTTLEMTKDSDPEEFGNIMPDETGQPIIRKVKVKYAQMYVCSGTDILEGPYNLPLDRIPVLRVPGWEVKVGDWTHRWGLIRFLKDPQRLHNYWRSVVAERLMQTPRAVWSAADTAVAGREKEWRNSHKTDDPLLIWNAESGQKPERMPPAEMEQAFISMSEMTSQDIKDVSNIHEANLGMPSNEVSGAAILARQRVSDTGTILYHDNLADAIMECGRVINLLIPVVYDTPRVIKTLGADGKDLMVAINQIATADHPNKTDITQGKYSVTVDVGPSYATKRIEAAQNMQNLCNAMPNVLAVAADLIVDAQDWPGADKIAMRLRMSMPSNLLSPDEITPQIAQQQQQTAQQQHQATTMAVQQAMAEFYEKQSIATLNHARAKNYEVTDAVKVQEMQDKATRLVVDEENNRRQAGIDLIKANKPTGATR